MQIFGRHDDRNKATMVSKSWSSCESIGYTQYTVIMLVHESNEKYEIHNFLDIIHI